jgi:peptidoglycan/xylan/chitin deacetylase (PgdA/CDA1 family)
VAYLGIIIVCATPVRAAAQSLAITLDDGPMVEDTPLMTPEARNDAIVHHLQKRHVKALFFVTLINGTDRPEGLVLLRRLSDAGQLIGNHTDTHPDFNAETTTLDAFEEEILRCDDVIRPFRGYRKLFRFPFLKEGASQPKRDGIRDFLKEHGYRIGYVSIDTADWLLDAKLKEALSEEPALDLGPWRELYLDHPLESCDGLRTASEARLRPRSHAHTPPPSSVAKCPFPRRCHRHVPFARLEDSRS